MLHALLHERLAVPACHQHFSSGLTVPCHLRSNFTPSLLQHVPFACTSSLSCVVPCCQCQADRLYTVSVGLVVVGG